MRTFRNIRDPYGTRLADLPGAAEAAGTGADPIMSNKGRPFTRVLRFLRDMARALLDRDTYDVRRNPSVWVGFLLALPIPAMTFAGQSDLWLRLVTLPAPLVWAAILGAAGRIGMLAAQERDRLAGEVQRVVGVARAAQAHLGETRAHLGAEQDKRRKLETEKQEVVSELRLAQAVQATLLPAPIQRPEVTVVAHNIPTRYVGGDYAHAHVVENRWLYLCLLDVSGHGISASLVVARMHGMVRRLTLTKKAPLEMLERLNRAAHSLLSDTYYFITGVVVRIDLTSGSMEFCSAGHPAQILLRADGSVEDLHTPNRLLGLHEEILDKGKPLQVKQLHPGDAVVLFTDGLFELLEDGEGEVLGEAGLRERVHGLGGLQPQLLIGEVLQELANFQGRSGFDDDVTMLVARFEGARLTGPGSPPRS